MPTTVPLYESAGDDPVEQARALVREAVARRSVRAVARELGVDISRLGAFVERGSTARPRGELLARVLAYADRRAVPAPPTAAGGSKSAGAPVVSDPSTMPPDYWYGRLQQLLALHRHVGDGFAELAEAARAWEGALHRSASSQAPAARCQIGAAE